ncbi:phytoene synthase [Natronorubrum sediminis]|uniref:Phytoene synthase n=1 Tax=Natronorubrum sediminis TaxID=640943 RepID=A0A1H6FWD2_9EURY|nr:phytoene/squalene synthase family protein [Natronorubrum sediminis]SEH15099.1 phytoene synthase [Natronorubrum sediminis]
MSTPSSHRATAESIHRRTGRTFHLATRLLPERARDPTHVMYAFFRVADEIVDDPEPESTTAQRRELEALRAEALGERDPTSDVMKGFAAVRNEHDLDHREIEIFLDAMAMDLERARYDTIDDLDDYLRGSSVAVAYLLTDVFAADLDPAVRPHAAALAEGFQLTNFLRDVREDVRKYDRIYLPREVLHRHGVTVDDIESLRFDDSVAAVIEDELERTESLYRNGVAGIPHLPEDVQFGVLLAAVLYAEHHRLIRQNGYDTLASRPSLSRPRRLAVTARTWYHWRRTRDPEAVFEAVSAISPGEPDAADSDSSSQGETTQVTNAGSTQSESNFPRPMHSARRTVGRIRTYFGTRSE